MERLMVCRTVVSLLSRAAACLQHPVLFSRRLLRMSRDDYCSARIDRCRDSLVVRRVISRGKRAV